MDPPAGRGSVSAPASHTREVLEGALRIIRETLGMDVAYVAEFTGGRQVLRVVDGDAASFGMAVGDEQAQERSYCVRMLRGELANVVPDSAADALVRGLDATTAAGIGAYVGVPLRFPNGAEGSLCCLSHHADPGLADRDITFVHALARLVEDHLDRHEIERRMREGLGAELVTSSAALRVALARLDASRVELIYRLSRAVEYRDDDTGLHTRRVSQLSHALALRAGLDTSTNERLLLASPLHDAGKVAVPDSVLLKPGRLTQAERAVIETHPDVGYELLRGSASETLELAAIVAWTHHERWDGGGYPRGLAGEEIPLEGRIVAIADVYDALVNDRVYRPAYSSGQATAVMREGRGTQFDPALLDLFLDEVQGSWASGAMGLAS